MNTRTITLADLERLEKYHTVVVKEVGPELTKSQVLEIEGLYLIHVGTDENDKRLYCLTEQY
jgi:hypothetical protein